jgi:hypothetical protein
VLAVVTQISKAGAARLVLSGSDRRARPDVDAIIRDATHRGLEVTAALYALHAARAAGHDGPSLG